VSIESITRVRAKKLKEALNGLVQNIWSKMDLEKVGTSNDVDQPKNTSKDPLHVPNGPMTRSKTKALKEALNGPMTRSKN